MSRPDLLVGIDVGMSCTGVATFNVNRKRLESYDVNIFREWGGRVSENKVPTVLTYDQRDMTKGPSAWGFETEEESQNTSNHIVREWFKTQFQVDDVLTPETELLLPDVDTLFKDYLTKLYECIRSRFTRHDLGGKTWDEARIAFMFSIPATWSTHTVAKFKEITKMAGFAAPRGLNDPPCPHTVDASLTEPLACAIHAATVESATFQNGDLALIVDAGGGTTDLSLVTIKSTTKGRIDISEHSGFPSEADDFGASAIDLAFEEMISQRLKASAPNLGLAHQAELVAWQMVRSQDFQASKPKLDLYQDNLDYVFRVRIKQLPDAANYSELRIVNGQMEFTWGELAALFDRQIDGIKELIERYLRKMEGNLISEEFNLSHIILSGGLGSSRYVQNQIEAAYGQSLRPVLKNVKVQASTDARLCVCKGLLYDRIQTLLTDKAAISRLACRQSYGVQCDTTYNRWNSTHRKLKKSNNVRLDDDGTKVIKNTVEWFVKKGSIMANGEETKFRYMLTYPADTDKLRLIGTVRIVTSTKDDTPLVKKERDGIDHEITLICDFANLDDSHIIVKNKHWYQRMLGKKPTKEIHFEIASKVGSAEVKFECRPIGSDQVLNVAAPAINATFDQVQVEASSGNVRNQD
ncbi:hypothetical protein G7054_g3492 [Neopestalotiopsis clavispora]|nr:hypothetical protein G7054_g3492 [Neopestalotiopsis clavispora]